MQIQRIEPGPNDVAFDPEATSCATNKAYNVTDAYNTGIDAYVGDRLSMAETCLMTAAFATLLCSFLLAVSVSV